MLEKLMNRWAQFVFKYPFLIIIVAFTIAAGGGYLTTNMGIRSDFAELLPENAQSVIDLKEISGRMGSMGTLIIQVEADDLKAMQRFADDLSDKLRKFPPDTLKFVDHKIDKQKDFFESNKFLYLSVQELSDLRDEMNDRISKEKLKATGMYLDLESDGEESEGFDFKKKKEEYEEANKHFDKYIDGYLTDKEGKSLIIVVKTPGTSTGVSYAQKMVKLVQAEIDKLDPKSYHESLDVFLTGNLTTLVEEYYALRDDILILSNMLVIAVFIAVAFYYRSIRMTMILCIGLLAGLLTTFGITYLHIGYLTASTAFLASIVAGNGINFGIYFLARYMEERRSGDPVPDILGRTLTGVIRSVATAAAAAGASYLSLMMTDFRGFNQFGFIGGVGMFICLIFALTLDPALTVVVERYMPFKKTSKEEAEKGRIFSHAAAWLVDKGAKPLFFGGVALTLISIIMLAMFLRDPYEYNFRVLRNQKSDSEGSGKRSSKAQKILGERSSPHVIMADNHSQVPQLKKVLEPYIADAPGYENGLFKNIKTVDDYLPGTEKEQKKKLKLLKSIRKIIKKNDFSFLSEEDQKLLVDLTPPEDLRMVTMDDLPDEILRLYIEDDGRRGTPVYVYMNDGMSVWNGHDLQRFAAVVREVKISEDESVRSSGHAVIFSDMLKFTADDGPRATLMAFAFVMVVIILSFRNLKHILVLALSMSAGVILMMGAAIMFGQKINFLNYIAIPIQFGIGVDYSVNLYSRFLEEGKGSIVKVLRSTGGAVMITSLTTIIGYSALWFSLNGAINTFGTLANLGEVTCLLVAILVMPSFLAIYMGGKAVAKKEEEAKQLQPVME